MLEAQDVQVRDERNARRDPISDAEARALLRSVSKVIVARGKKSVELPAGEVSLDQLKGPTGNYRAPMVRRGKTLLVGFDAQRLRELV